MSGWEVLPLSDVLDLSNGKGIKPGGVGSYPVYGSNGLIGGTDNPRHEEGIVIGRVGAYCGSLALPRSPFWASDNTIVATPVEGKLDLRFGYYGLANLNLNRWAGGAAQPLLTQTVLRGVPIRVPHIAVQRKIAAVLAAYDELIESNLRRIEILEEMAQAVYREWFVNFRFPGHEDIALVDSPLGPIPEGWEVGAFGDLAENRRASINPAKYPDEDFDHFSFAAFDEGGLPSIEPSATMMSSKLLVEQDSVLLAKLNPRIPRVWFVRPSGTRRSIASSEFLILVSRMGMPLELLYAVCSDPTLQSRLAAMSGGTSTSHQRLKLDDLLRLPLPIAPAALVQRFGSVAAPIYQLGANLTAQNANLRSTRDILLPKLVSGQIDVSELDIDTEWLAS